MGAIVFLHEMMLMKFQCVCPMWIFFSDKIICRNAPALASIDKDFAIVSDEARDKKIKSIIFLIKIIWLI